MAVMTKRENLLETAVAETSNCFRPSAEDTLDVLKQEIMTKLRCLVVSTKNFSTRKKDCTCENLEKKLEFILTDPPRTLEMNKSFRTPVTTSGQKNKCTICLKKHVNGSLLEDRVINFGFTCS